MPDSSQRGGEKSPVERLKNRLYARDTKAAEEAPRAHERAPLTPEKTDTPVNWTAPPAPTPDLLPVRPLLTPEEEPHTMNLATKFLIGSIMFFVAAALAAGFTFFGGGNVVSSRNIDLEIVAPSLVDGGKEGEFEIIITNRNRTSLELADLIFEYPEGTRDPNDITKPMTHERQSIGTIGSGEQIKRTARAVFYGSEGVQQQLDVSLEYTVAGSNAIFVKEASTQFLVGSSPVTLRVEAPETAVAGVAFPITLTVQSNASTPVDNVLIEGQYPFGFTVLETSPSAEVGGLLWRLGTLPPGSTRTIQLIGMLDATAGDERVFRFLAGSDSDTTNTRIRVPFLTQPVTISLTRPLIAATLEVDGKTGANISTTAGKTLQGRVNWHNDLTEPLSNVEFALVFEGPMFDAGSVRAQGGFYQSNNRVITWTSAEDPSLSLVSPGDGGTLNFSFGTLQPGSGSTLYTNPVVNLLLTMKGVRQGNASAEQVTAATAMQITLASNLSLLATAARLSGPAEPRVGQQATYQITWSARNSSNAIGNAAVASVLPAHVQFVSGSGVTYDQSSRTVRWNIGDLAAGAGYTLPERTASFQVSVTPSTSQVNTNPSLTGAAVLTGQDRFAQVEVSATANPPTLDKVQP